MFPEEIPDGSRRLLYEPGREAELTKDFELWIVCRVMTTARWIGRRAESDRSSSIHRSYERGISDGRFESYCDA